MCPLSRGGGFPSRRRRCRTTDEGKDQTKGTEGGSRKKERTHGATVQLARRGLVEQKGVGNNYPEREKKRSAIGHMDNVYPVIKTGKEGQY